MTDPLIDGLVAGLTPVRPRRPWRETAVLAALGVVEIAAYLQWRPMRPDMMAAMHTPSLWWKAGSLLLIAVIALAAVLAGAGPAPSRARWRSWLLAAGVAALAAGLVIASGQPSLIARIGWREGITCALAVVVLSLPAAAALALLLRRAAPARPVHAATAAGLAAAAWGGFVFTIACPHDDPLYIIVWFGLAVLIITAAARWLVTPLVRW